MKAPSENDASNLEAEYIRMKALLYKNFFNYCIAIVLIVLSKEAFRAIWYTKYGSLVMICCLSIFGGLSVYFIGRQKENKELSITISLLLLYSSALLTQYYSNSGYFEYPLEAFNFAFAYAAFERIVWNRISKFSHRTGFLICTTIIRTFSIVSASPSLIVMQFVYLFFTIYLDLDREKYDRRFFATYFKNKEQLLKFKNLVVQDIPESILIITQDLMRPLFVNNSLKELIEDNTNKDIRTKLQQFLVSDSLNVSRESSQDSMNSIPQRGQNKNLFQFLESTILQANRSIQNQKFSCNLSYKKVRVRNGQNDEKKYIFEAKIVHLLWDDELAIAVILHDITQQNTILSLKIANAHKDTILATVSHELRTPLYGILGMVQIIQKKVNDSEIMNCLNICKNSGLLLLGLVNSILDMNQIRSKKLKLCIERVNVAELLDNIINMFEFQCRQKRLDLKLKISPNCPQYINTDKNRLSQIFINLVGNALKFTQKGGITISACQVQNIEDITFTVEDTGTGIKDEDKQKLFKVFGKLEQSDRNVNPHGVGLGLTISDTLARLLGREGIQLESQYGKGSKFILSIKKSLRDTSYLADTEMTNLASDLPRRLLEERGDVRSKMEAYSRKFVKSSQQPLKASHSPKLAASADLASSPLLMRLHPLTPEIQRKSALLPESTIQSRFTFLEPTITDKIKMTTSKATPYALVVDDNPLNVIITESLIASHGYKTKSAINGKIAVDIISDCDFSLEPIKLVFMDCQMPVMDGYKATKILKKMMLEKKIPDIAIVALTANDSEADKEASKKAGMCEHVSKPLKETELVRVLNRYMS